MTAYIIKKTEIFYRELLYPRHFRIIIIIYITLKITGKLFYNESYFTGLKNGVIGILIYWLAMYAINLVSTNKDTKNNKVLIRVKTSKRNSKDSSKQELIIAKKGLFVSILYIFFLFLLVYDYLQRRNLVAGHPILSYIPGYDGFLSLLQELSRSIADLADFIFPYQILNIIIFGIFLILLPYLIFRFLGYSYEGLFSLRNSIAALPVLALSIILSLSSGIKGYWAWNLFYTILYPAIGEAFFHRGIVYRSAARSIKTPATAMVVSAGALCLLYFPDIYYRICAGSITSCMSRMGDVFLHGLFMAYAYRKTETILPWILVHALTNTLYF